MRKLHSIAVALALLAGSAGAALAQAPEPRATINVDRFMGRWYEIARLPNAGQRDCQAAYSQFTAAGSGAFKVSQICHRGSATGPAKAFNTTGRILPGTKAAKFCGTKCCFQLAFAIEAIKRGGGHRRASRRARRAR